MTTTHHPYAPTNELQAVLIRDGAHDGTIVLNLGEGRGFLFHSLDNHTTDTRTRCVLVALAPPQLNDETGVEITWDQALPDGTVHGFDLDGQGYALIGLELDVDIDSAVGDILWDSAVVETA
jgi:hypothetical protein